MGNKYMEVHYLHRDDGNYKTHGVVSFKNRKKLSPTEIKKTLNEYSLDKDGAFYPLEVGLRILYGSEHEWHELTDVIEVEYSDNIDLPDISSLIQQFQKMSKRHIHSRKHKSVIPSISSLIKDVITVLNELWRVLFSYRGKVVLVAIHLDDYATIEETLEMDSQSTAFDPDIRESLKRGLKRMKEIDVKPVFELRRKLLRIEKEIPR